jgi:gliding motility-associated-like protein
MRLNIILIAVTLTVLLFDNDLSGQSIKRSVIASTGVSFSNSQFRIASTSGQPPNPGTVQGNNGVFLRQGFQQPVASTNGTDDNCNFTATFDIDSEDLGECGTYYSFIYTGTSDPDIQYSWDFGEGALPPTSTEMNPSQIAYSNIGLKTIVLTITKDSCVEEASRIINVTDPGFGVQAISTDLLCFGDGNGSIQLQVFNGQPAYVYEWGDTSANVEKRFNLSAGNYSFTVTDAFGCSFSGIENVQGPANALAITVSYQDESCVGTLDGEISIEVNGGTSPYTYEWSNGTSDEQILGLGAGSYSLTVVDDNSCIIDTSVILVVFCEDGDNGIPDVISPNGDGKNDVWIIPGIENYPDNEVYIFNRWGGTVYSMKSYMNTWAGTTSDGDPLQVGAYFYLIQLNDEYGTEFSGSITIIR